MFISNLLLLSGFAILLWSSGAVGQGGVSGFPQKELISKTAGSIGERVPYNSDGEWRVYPGLRFTCSGTISGVTVIGYTSANVRLELGLWSLQSQSSNAPNDPAPPSSSSVNIDAVFCQLQRHSGVTIEPSTTNTREPGFHTLTSTFANINVENGTILSMRQREGIILYQRPATGLPSYPSSDGNRLCIQNNDLDEEEDLRNFDYPIISVEIDCDCVDCTEGFRPTTTLDEIVQQESQWTYSSKEMSVIPDLHFTKPGRVSGWQFAARRVSGSEGSAVPQIQFWRPVMGAERQSDVNMYTLISSTSMSDQDLRQDEDNVFFYQFRSDVDVEAGDVVGVEQPEDSQLFLVFQRSDQVINYVTDLDHDSTEFDVEDSKNVTRLPLLRPDFRQASEPTPPDTPPSQPQPSSEPTPPTDTPPSQSQPSSEPTLTDTPPSQPQPSSPPSELSLPAIVGGVMGVVVTVLVVLVGCVLVCILWRRRRRGSKRHRGELSRQPTVQNGVLGNNPVYEAPMDDDLAEPFYVDPVTRSDNSELYESIRGGAQVYEVPTTSLGLDQQPPEGESQHAYHVLEASRNQYQDKGDKEEDNYDSEDYQLLECPPSADQDGAGGEGEGGEEGGEMQHEYQELEADHHQGSNHLTLNQHSKFDVIEEDYELFVPSVEQRQTVRVKHNSHTHQHPPSRDIYESLRETQLRYTSVSPASCQFFEESPSFWQPGSTTESLYQQLSSRKFREILRHQIQTLEHLGSGQFGTVKKGVWQSSKGVREVAVKMLQHRPTTEDTVRFLQEAAIMGQFRHPNIVQLLGVVTVEEPLMIVLELLCNGDLNTYLNKNRPSVVQSPGPEWSDMLLSFCQHVAAGMDYLSTKGFVHRDLAARNILLSKDKICKISDFGMSRDLQNDNYYITRGGEIPVKWTAPETLNYKKYSTASDVWSYGAVMYEIWSVGHKPYESYTNQETVRLVSSGHRLAPPPGCPQEIYRLMIHCWHPRASSRPSSSEILQELTRQDERSLLQWREEDTQCHPQASLLGAELEAGKNLYTELQQLYLLEYS